MENKEKRSNYWLRKWQTNRWEDFETLEVGAVFDTSVSNHVQMRGTIGDRILWYRSDKDQGIYFATEVIAEPKQDDAYQNGWSMSLRVVNTLVSNPVKLKKSDFNNLIADVDAKYQGGSTSNILEKYQPEKLWELVIGNEKATLKDFDTVEINNKDLENIEKIKLNYINKSAYAFNPFLDINLAKSEVRHLYFITNLLNPQGSHLQGNKFLKTFIEELLLHNDIQDRDYLEDFCNHENIHVEVEYSIPKGRIDMWIENDDYVIAIEGKTETKDSKGQLKKYDDFLKEYCQERDKKYLLCYLTKYADAPEYNEVEDIKLLGFNQDILPFIGKVKNEELPDRLKYFIEEYYYALVIY
ncbi:PD-(D/E)XK nuclease family protein, partial [Poseidonibacter sp.]|uniref:PDDEXK-like family protein n=1 Tax=Poseidonibacter sp. TaxID=2321188 RepID=UPI003C78A1FE